MKISKQETKWIEKYCAGKFKCSHGDYPIILKAFKFVYKKAVENTKPSTVINKEILGVIAKDCVPVSWLDPLLTGKEKVVTEAPCGCLDIENLLNSIKERIKNWNNN